MKKNLLFLALMLLPILASAQTLVGGVYYYLYPTSKVAIVTSGDSEYAGTVQIPESVTYDGTTYTVNQIGSKAFSRCSDLKVVTLPSTIKRINSMAFQDCTGLEAISLPNGLLTIDWQAFFRCSSLKRIFIPASVSSISGDSFSGCTGLIAINVDSENEIYHSLEGYNCIIETATNTLVQGCNETVIPSGVTIIGEDAFSYMTNIVNCSVPEGITTIQNSAYNACSGIKTVTIANSVTNIESYAFNYCTSMETLTIGKGVKKIAPWTFQNCTNLETVTIYAKTPPVAEIDEEYDADPFMEYDEGSYRANVTLYVPSSSVDAYKSDSYWGGFKEIVALPNKCDTPIITLKDGQVSLSCDTEDVEFVSTISREFAGTEINPNGVYTLSVYATKEGYEDSDVVTKDVEMNYGKKGDVNGDGKITITDAVGVVNMILNGGDSTSAPAMSEPQQMTDPE